jgi:hypothetical protein
MASANKSGQIAPSIRANGKIIKQKARELLPIPMEIIIRDNGKKIKLMDMVFLCTRRLGLDLKAIGKMTCSMVQELKHIVMEISMKGCFETVREMGMEPIITLQDKSTKEAGTMEEYKAKVFAFGQMEKNIKDNGRIIKNMDKENILGPMADSMKVITEMIRNMASVLILGLMGVSILDNGKTIKDMEEEHTL